MHIKFKKALWPILIALLLLFVFYARSLPPLLSDSIGGTYQITSTCFISFELPDLDDTFYYTDVNKKYYIKGNFRKISEDTYLLVCSNTENKQIIPDQEIAIKDQTITLQIGADQIAFSKVADIPYLTQNKNAFR